MQQPELRLYRGKWCAYWRENGKPIRRSFGTADRALAEQALADAIERERGPRDTCGEIIEAYLAEKLNRVTDHRRLCECWRVLKSTFASLRPDQVNVAKSREYHDHRHSTGVGNNTINKELRMLKAALNWHDNRHLARIEMLPGTPPKERHLTKPEFMRLLDGAKAPHMKLWLILAISTAARPAAILDLTWSRVDFEANRIRLANGGDGQFRKGRATVPMTNSVRDALIEAKEAALSPYVIEYGGNRLMTVRTGIRNAAQRAGLKGVTPYVLRHSAACWMAEGGSMMSEIAQFLGHSDSRITERVYAKYSPEHLAGAASALEL